MWEAGEDGGGPAQEQQQEVGGHVTGPDGWRNTTEDVIGYKCTLDA